MKNIIGILIFFALLQGCAGKPVTSGTGTEQVTANDNWQAHLKVDNPTLAKRLVISNVLTRTTNGLLDVNLELTSSYKKTQNLQYHFNWFDKDGFVIEQGKEPWKSLPLHGHQVVNLGAIAPTKDVVKFRLYVREINETIYRF